MGEEESIADVPVPDDDEAEKDPILDLAIDYAVQRTYPDGLSKEKKRAVRKKADAAQCLIKATYPNVNGLQDVSLGHTLAFDVLRGEFIQILHTGESHWVTVSTIGCTNGEVDVFDSMPPHVTGALERQIAAIICTEKNAITVRYVIIIVINHHA